MYKTATMKILLTIVFVVFTFLNICLSQDNLPAAKILSPENFISAVKSYHPVLKQADISIEKAKADITAARGGFDPSLYLHSEQKTFDGKNYYTYTNPELKIPTWYGIEVKAGLENNGGQFLNSEASLGQTSYIGISLPLAKNLLMDKRRATLLQAKYFKELSEAERLNTINDLLYNAYAAYWNWVKEYQVYAVLTATVKINADRLELIKIAFRQGDRPAIDTIEALTQLQGFQFQQSVSWVALNNATVELSNYLWLSGNRYYELGPDVVPEKKWNEQDITSLPAVLLDELLYAAKLNHPKLKMYSYKLQVLEIERKLKFQGLLPTVNLKANLLNKGYDMFNGIGKTGFYENNNKFGVDIGLPLRLSEGRGGYKSAKLKIQETNYELSLKQQEIENKVKYYYNELTGLLQQVKIYEAVYKNCQTLFRGEDIRFQAGESSLFVLNSRENKQLEALQKLVELKTKYYKTRQAVLWASGQLR